MNTAFLILPSKGMLKEKLKLKERKSINRRYFILIHKDVKKIRNSKIYLMQPKKKKKRKEKSSRSLEADGDAL